MRVACLQMNSSDVVDENLKEASRLLASAKQAGTELAVLPENFAFMSKNEKEKKRIAQREEASSLLAFLAEQSRHHNLFIIGGTVPLSSDKPPGLRNACPVFSPEGELLVIYDKMHLFELNLGQERYREGEYVVAGDRPVSVHLDAWHLGLSICYDIRFPELYRHYSAAGCHAMSIPAAFTVPTGRAHWETLLRARAIENQAYVLAAAQWGTHPGGRKTWGHTMIIDPWGDILAEKEEGVGVVVAEMCLSHLENIRNILPALRHRRL